MLKCPNRAGDRIIKNVRIHNGKQKFKCQDCGRQFVEQPTKKIVDSDTQALIDRSLLVQLLLAGIAPAAQMSEQLLQTYVNERYAQVPRQLQVKPEKEKLMVQCDEIWSCVDNKGNKQRVWVTLDAHSLEIVGVHISATARKLWDYLPPVYRQCAVAYTDWWAADAAVFPCEHHRAVGKQTGKASYIERFNNAFRQRVSLLV